MTTAAAAKIVIIVYYRYISFWSACVHIWGKFSSTFFCTNIQKAVVISLALKLTVSILTIIMVMF